MTKIYLPALNVNADCIGTCVFNNEELPICSDLLKIVAKKLKERIKNQNQNVVVVAGKPGSGKSSLALQTIYALDPAWRLEDNYIYDASDMAKKLRHRQTANPISLFDEGSVSLNSLDFNKSGSKQTIVMLDTCRSLGWTTFICIPSLRNLNKNITDHLLDYLLYCPHRPLIKGYATRGFFILYKPHSGLWSTGTYYQPIAAGIYPKLTGDHAREYESIKLQHQINFLDEYIDKFGEAKS